MHSFHCWFLNLSFVQDGREVSNRMKSKQVDLKLLKTKRMCAENQRGNYSGKFLGFLGFLKC